MRNNDTSIGKVYFKEDEGIHLNEFYNVEDGKSVKGYTKLARIAHLVISDEENDELNKDETNKEKILKNIKDKYTPYLVKAIKQESKINDRDITFDELQVSQEININKKIVKLDRTLLYNAKSCGVVLQIKDYNHAYNEKLEEKDKIKDEEKSTSVLSFDRNKCQDILNSEQRKEAQAHSIISLAYVYHIKKDSKNDELELVLYEDLPTVSFMPEQIVEYGVFFDGTNNNIHNIDFYKNFTEFLKEPAEYIKENRGKEFRPKPDIKLYKTIQDYIVSEPNPKLNDDVLKIIINQINNTKKETNNTKKETNNTKKEIIYFDKESNLSLEEKEILDSSKAKHSSKVFEYLLDVKNGKKNIKKEDREKFVREEILVDKDEDSSYTNGETNISRLYNIYNGNDIKRNKKALVPTRFKLYESGAGTSNPFINEDYGKDGIFGLGLDFGYTGVKAHIIYSCLKIAEQLRASDINHIDELVLDVFGFSRGASAARHFVNSILKDCELVENGNKKYSVKTKKDKNIFSSFFKDGYVIYNGNKIFNPFNTKNKTYNQGRDIIANPYYGQKEIKIDSLSFRFIGIYDTVTHHGVIQSNDFKDLNIDFFENKEKIGQVVHLMADEEYRYNFDTSSIFTDINKEFYKTKEESPSKGKKFEEYYIPGAHADVGGGYNIEDELILLTQRRVSGFDISFIKAKLEAWNRKYNWLEKTTINQVNSKKDILNNEDGFYYYIKQEYRTNYSVNTLFVYMYKKQVSNKYEHIALRLMHDRALYKDISRSLDNENLKDDFERVPLGRLDNYCFYRDDTLDKVYDILKERKELKTENQDLYRKLKHTYLHHSSKLSFVNKPSYEDKETNDFYGKRVIYSASGVKFTRG